MRRKKTIRCALSGRWTVAGWCEPWTIGAGTLLQEQPACCQRTRGCVREQLPSRCVGCVVRLQWAPGRWREGKGREGKENCCRRAASQQFGSAGSVRTRWRRAPSAGSGVEERRGVAGGAERRARASGTKALELYRATAKQVSSGDGASRARDSMFWGGGEVWAAGRAQWCGRRGPREFSSRGPPHCATAERVNDMARPPGQSNWRCT